MPSKIVKDSDHAGACQAEAFSVGGLNVFCMPRKSTSSLFLVIVLLLVIDAAAREPQKSPPARATIGNKVVRARDLGVPFEGTPGKFNAITDVAGVEVGFTTLVNGDGKLIVGQGPVRTGVTGILP